MPNSRSNGIPVTQGLGGEGQNQAEERAKEQARGLIINKVIQDGQCRSNSCTVAASKAATRAAMVLADVLKRADQRAGDLAATADQARARGMTCEKAYDALGN